jgi:hypothetical protein
VRHPGKEGHVGKGDERLAHHADEEERGEQREDDGVWRGIPARQRGTQGTTIAWFPLAPAGPAPWRVYVKLAGIEPTTIVVGGPLR